ncbi:MAG TPA: YwiC-like family protein [Longimicrobiales bacterium]|nr:YwiC-like family protein [Longimicrobiales bacterium]
MTTTRMRPREHGAYAMLAFPVLSGLLLGGPSAAGIGFVAAAVGAFLTHEPAAVLLGARGQRLATAARSAAWRRLTWGAGLAGAGALLFLLTSPTSALQGAVWPVAGAAGVTLLLLTGSVKTIPGEAWVAITFASVHVPVAAAGGATGVAVWLPALVWAGGFIPPTLAVHALKTRFRAARREAESVPGRWTTAVAPGVATAIVAAAVAAAVLGGLAGSMAVLPMAGAAGVISLLAIHPRHLKRVGWTMVFTDVATLTLLVVLLA